MDAWDSPAQRAMAAYDKSRDPGFVVDGGMTSTGALGFGSGADVIASIGKKQRELAGGFTASRTDKYAGFDTEIGCNAAGRVLEKDGGEFNTAGKQGMHDYSATEAGRFILEEKRKFEAAKAAMSETKVRDADGTIDRVDDSVSAKLMPILWSIKERCRTENINLEGVFEEAGGSHFGTIKRQNFQSTLVNTFKRFKFEEETLIAIVSAYGCGYQHPGNPTLNIPPLHEHVGWKDFCEDVGKAYDTTFGVASESAQVRSSWVTPIKLGMRADLVEGWDPSSAGPLFAISDSPDGEQLIETNVNPETVLASAGSIENRAIGLSGHGAGMKVVAANRRKSHPPKEPGMIARKTGRDQYGEYLLDLINGIDPVTQEPLGPPDNPLRGQMDKIIKLIDQGKSFNLEVYEDDEQSTPLMEAVAMGNVEVVEKILKTIFKEFAPSLAEKFIIQEDNDGNTARSLAAKIQRERPEIAKMLTNAGLAKFM